MSIPRDPNDPGFPVHPGELLLEDFMVPLGLTPAALAQSLRLPESRIVDLVEGKAGIDGELAYRLMRYFGMTASFWIGLQSDYELGRIRYSEGYARLLAEVEPRERREEFAGAA